jgi:cell division protein FtsZ
MVTKPGMVNIDFADLRSVLKDSGYAVIGVGESNGVQTKDRAIIAVENTLKSPLLDVDLRTAKKALINIIGGQDLTLREAESIFQEVSSRISDEAMLKWGARIEPDMQKSALKVMVVMGGVEYANYTEEGIKNKVAAAEENSDLDEMFE